MNKQPVAYGHRTTPAHTPAAPLRWLARVFTQMQAPRRERHRCNDVLARVMRDSALGG